MKKFFTSFLLICFCCKVNATIYTVNNNTDVVGSATTRTLRYCITTANSNVGKDTIDFLLTGGGPYTITIASNLPVISDPLVIRGFTQSGAVQGQLGTGTRVMQVILNGPGNNTVYGLQFTASNCEVSGLVIQNFYVGIYLNGSDNSFIWGNYIGTNNTGLSVSASTTCYDDGIRLNSNANNNFIGTNGDGSNDANEGNCIGGNGDGGTQYLGECIAINEGGLIGADCTGNRIAGNYLGINETGNAALWTISTVNTQRGSGIHITNCTNNIIGTNADGVSDTYERNVISGNSDAGVVLQGCSGCKVKGNYIGTDKTGLIGVTNYSNGGTSVATTQISIKSTSSGNYIGTDGDGTRDNIEGNVIGSSSIVAGGANSYSDGIDVAGTGNHICGNYIGIGSNGTTALSILTTGITVNDYAIYVTGSGNYIGTNGDGVSDAYESNYIGNSGSGVYIESTSGEIVAGNYFGLGTNLTTSEPLGYAGVFVANSTTSRIGSSGSNSLEKNYFCNSSQHGIWIDNFTVKSNDLLNVRYNTIGLRPDGVAAPNLKNGILLNGESDADTIQYNIISRNGTASAVGAYAAIQLGWNIASGETTDNVVKNNTIYKNNGPGINMRSSQTIQNKVSQNSIYNNGNGSDATGKFKLGIDLDSNGVTANDIKDPDSGPNSLSNFPIITGAMKGGASCTQSVTGTFNGLANTQYYVEVFSSDVCNGDTSGVDYFANVTYNYGEGRTYEGASTAFTTDGNGNGNWSAAISITNSTGQYLTATAIQSSGTLINSTSEFSLCYNIKSDFGDAPDTYHTLLANCGPIHLNTASTLTIGSTITVEDDGQPSAAANLDTDDGISSFPTITDKSTSYTLSNIPVVNTTGSTATLYAWIDFNRNSSFELSEYASATVASGATSATLSWNLAGFTCESTLKSGVSYLRMRLTTTALTDDGTTSSVDERCYGIANDGEVEDYKIYIAGYDYGDLPATYPVAIALALEDTATAKVWAGTIKPGIECTQKYSIDALGDGTEEDGLTTSIGPSGSSYTWVIRLNANQAAKTVYYGLWIDWDGNGNFTSGLDAFYSGSATVTGLTNKNVSVYAPYGIYNSAFRLMVSDAAVTSGMYNATITNGEIEDWLLLQILASPGNILMGSRQTTGNLLKWRNTSSLDIREYTIERSADNLTWTSLGTVPALNGNSSTQYLFTDAHPGIQNYYRLKFILGDNTVKYSNTLPLFENNNALPVLLYPNPVTNSLRIQTANGNYNRLVIMDLTGRFEIQQEINSVNTVVDVSNIAAGSHLVKFFSKDGQVEVRRFVKIK